MYRNKYAQVQLWTQDKRATNRNLALYISTEPIKWLSRPLWTNLEFAFPPYMNLFAYLFYLYLDLISKIVINNLRFDWILWTNLCTLFSFFVINSALHWKTLKTSYKSLKDKFWLVGYACPIFPYLDLGL